MRPIEREGLRELMARGAQVVEVLAPDQFEDDHLPGAVNIPLRRIDRDARTALDSSAPVVVYCWDSA
ncbi:MAG: rhodanese-like domain-containing protein [Actinomycetota bacterium]